MNIFKFVDGAIFRNIFPEIGQVGTKGVTKGVTNQAVDAATNAALKDVGREGGEVAGKNISDDLVANAAGDISQDATKITAKDNRIITKDTVIEETKDVSTKIENNPNELLQKSAKDLSSKFNGKPIAAIIAGAVLVTGFALAYDNFLNNNKKQLIIIESYSTTDGKSGDVTIVYEPNTTVVPGDTISFNQPNSSDSNEISLSRLGKRDIINIISDTTIVVNIPFDIIPPIGTKITLHTTLENQILHQAVSATTAIKKTASPLLSGITSMLGPFLLPLKIFCYVFIFIILIMIIYKIYKAFKKN
jgi:hypothetical protein